MSSPKKRRRESRRSRAEDAPGPRINLRPSRLQAAVLHSSARSAGLPLARQTLLLALAAAEAMPEEAPHGASTLQQCMEALRYASPQERAEHGRMWLAGLEPAPADHWRWGATLAALRALHVDTGRTAAQLDALERAVQQAGLSRELLAALLQSAAMADY